jgi:hypothetical protein
MILTYINPLKKPADYKSAGFRASHYNSIQAIAVLCTALAITSYRPLAYIPLILNEKLKYLKTVPHFMPLQ